MKKQEKLTQNQKKIRTVETTKYDRDDGISKKGLTQNYKYNYEYRENISLKARGNL